MNATTINATTKGIHTAEAVTSVVDRAALLERVGGDEDLLREIAAIFLEEYPSLVEEIRAAVRASDANRLERAAHSLKGSVANFGAQSATRAAYLLESLGRKGQFEGAPAAMAELLAEFQQLHPELLALAN